MAYDEGLTPGELGRLGLVLRTISLGVNRGRAVRDAFDVAERCVRLLRDVEVVSRTRSHSWPRLESGVQPFIGNPSTSTITSTRSPLCAVERRTLDGSALD